MFVELLGRIYATAMLLIQLLLLFRFVLKDLDGNDPEENVVPSKQKKRRNSDVAKKKGLRSDWLEIMKKIHCD